MNQVDFLNDIILNSFTRIEDYVREFSKKTRWTFGSKKARLLMEGRTDMLIEISHEFRLSFSRDCFKRIHNRMLEHVKEDGEDTTRIMGEIMYLALSSLFEEMTNDDIKDKDIERFVEQGMFALTQGGKCNYCLLYSKKECSFECTDCKKVIWKNCLGSNFKAGDMCNHCHLIPFDEVKKLQIKMGL